VKCRCVICEPDRAKPSSKPSPTPNPDPNYAVRIGGLPSVYPHVVDNSVTYALSRDGVFHDNAALVPFNRWSAK
jgi:hypothetical protein